MTRYKNTECDKVAVFVASTTRSHALMCSKTGKLELLSEYAMSVAYERELFFVQ